MNIVVEFYLVDPEKCLRNCFIRKKHLKSLDTIISYFELEREGETLKPTEALQHHGAKRPGWLAESRQ